MSNSYGFWHNDRRVWISADHLVDACEKFQNMFDEWPDTQTVQCFENPKVSVA